MLEKEWMDRGKNGGRRREGREIYVRLYFAWYWKSDLKSVFFFKFRFFLLLCARARAPENLYRFYQFFPPRHVSTVKLLSRDYRLMRLNMRVPRETFETQCFAFAQWKLGSLFFPFLSFFIFSLFFPFLSFFRTACNWFMNL